MIEVTIDSIRVSLMSQHRVVILKDGETDRYLPIWIGACEADAITIELQGVEVARPFTHDLLKASITQLGGKIKSVVISDLRSEVFYAQIVLDVNGHRMEIDSRPSDALALAVRAKVPIYVSEEVMEKAAITPEDDLSEGGTEDKLKGSPFSDLIDNLNLDDFGEGN
jgi:bifunctional DNase/RNase